MQQEGASPDSFVFQVNLGGMIDILSNHLYSAPDVFVRELLQNAVDAIAAKRKQFPEDRSENEICLILSEENGIPQLCFTDTGTGLTKEEIHRFLAVIGQSSKHDLAAGRVQEDYIGRFGIGLLSCFLVSDVIRVQTRSFRTPEQSLEWCGNPDGTYTITECDPLPKIGTRILLTPKKDAEKYFTAERLTQLVQYYGLPLPEPILLVQGTQKKLLNPPFPSGETQYAQIMTLGETLFGAKFLGYIPLDSPSGLFSGIAYILSAETAPTAKHSHRIYLKNMLLTEDGTKLLPKWAFFVRVFLNTNGLQPTASREDFYENDALLRAREELSGCLTDYLKALAAKGDPLLQRIVRIHRLAVQSVATEDDALFRAFFPYLTFETSFGTLTGSDLLELHTPVYYSGYLDEFRQVAAISAARNTLLVNAGYTYVAQLLERMPLLQPDISVMQMKTERLDEMLEKPELADPAAALRLIAECNTMLADYDCTASLKRFAPAELPVLFSVNEDALLLRDIRHSMEQTADLFRGMLDAFAGEYREDAVAKLYLNTDNPLIRRLMQLSDSEKLQCCLEILYIQALLTGGYPMRKNEMQLLNQDLLRLLDWSIS
ncbi:MAG: HSP90 family protein [Oscillospiraceae bacterium]|nr:HSP90 family protein [Oscillospiraceae bacterium]